MSRLKRLLAQERENRRLAEERRASTVPRAGERESLESMLFATRFVPGARPAVVIDERGNRWG